MVQNWSGEFLRHEEVYPIIAETRAEIERLKSLVYVPGLWRCAKCNFSLVQANLNAKDGTVTARDKPGDKCPNCDSPLWRVTERDAGNEMVDRAEDASADRHPHDLILPLVK